MGEHTPTSEEQIRILTAKILQLELLCAWLVEFFAREDASHTSRSFALSELRRHAESHQGEVFSHPDETSFGQAAKYLRVGTFANRGFGAGGARR